MWISRFEYESLIDRVKKLEENTRIVIGTESGITLFGPMNYPVLCPVNQAIRLLLNQASLEIKKIKVPESYELQKKPKK